MKENKVRKVQLKEVPKPIESQVEETNNYTKPVESSEEEHNESDDTHPPKPPGR